MQGLICDASAYGLRTILIDDKTEELMHLNERAGEVSCASTARETSPHDAKSRKSKNKAQKLQLLPNSFFYIYFCATSLQVVYKSNRFCCAVGMLRRVSSSPAMSSSASTKAGSWPVVARISPQGLTIVLCPHAW